MIRTRRRIWEPFERDSAILSQESWSFSLSLMLLPRLLRYRTLLLLHVDVVLRGLFIATSCRVVFSKSSISFSPLRQS